MRRTSDRRHDKSGLLGLGTRVLRTRILGERILAEHTLGERGARAAGLEARVFASVPPRVHATAGAAATQTIGAASLRFRAVPTASTAVRAASVLVVAALLAIGAAAGTALAQGAGGPDELAIARRAHSVAGELMSPYCAGRTIANCPHPNAGYVRDEISKYIEVGLTDDEIKARIQSEFGAWAAAPDSPASWTVPIVVLAIGALALGALLLRTRASVDSAPAGVSAAVEKEIQAELDEALAARGAGQG